MCPLHSLKWSMDWFKQKKGPALTLLLLQQVLSVGPGLSLLLFVQLTQLSKPLAMGHRTRLCNTLTHISNTHKVFGFLHSCHAEDKLSAILMFSMYQSHIHP